MRVKVALVVVVMALVWCGSAGAQVTYAPRVIDMAPSKGGWVPVTPSSTPMVRNTPAMVRSGTLTKVFNSRLGVASLVILSSSMLYEAVKQYPELFPETRSWLAKMGYAASGGVYIRQDSNIMTPVAGTPFESCVQAAAIDWTQNGATPVDDVFGFGTQPPHTEWNQRMYRIYPSSSAPQKCQATTSFYGSKNCGGYGLTGTSIHWYTYKGLYNWSPYTCEFAGKTLVSWYISGTPVPQDQYTEANKTGPTVTTKVVQDGASYGLNDNPNNISADEKTAIDEQLERAGEAIRKNTDMLSKNADATTKLADRLQDLIKGGIGATVIQEMQNAGENATEGQDQTSEYNGQKTTEGSGSSGGSGQAVCGAPPLPPCDVTGDWNDSQTTPPDVSETGINEQENDQVIGDQSAGVTEQRGILTAMFNELMTAVNSLVSRIMAEVDRWVGDQSAGACNVGAVEVWGGSFGLDFCEIDLSGWRQLVIAFFGILSAVVLVTGWRS